jgi:hypothetical protein
MTMKLFKADAGVFQPIQKRQFGIERLEKNLEDWLGANPHLLGDDIMLIGRQVKTDHGAFIDLLALDQHGRVVVIELKRGRAPRDTVAQLNDYLTAISGWSDGELARKANLIPYDRARSTTSFADSRTTSKCLTRRTSTRARSASSWPRPTSPTL